MAQFPLFVTNSAGQYHGRAVPVVTVRADEDGDRRQCGVGDRDLHGVCGQGGGGDQCRDEGGPQAEARELQTQKAETIKYTGIVRKCHLKGWLKNYFAQLLDGNPQFQFGPMPIVNISGFRFGPKG